jgi:3-phenylpropionate/cinnamic acid dioxygenase small subunit
VRPDELAAREQVRHTIAAYAHAVDRGRFDEAAACFTADGVLDVRGSDRSEGRDAVAARFAVAGQKLAAASTQAIVRHHVSSIDIEADVTAGTATSSSYFFVVTEIGPDHWGTYRDTFRRDDATGRWLISERQVTVDGRTAPSRMA